MFHQTLFPCAIKCLDMRLLVPITGPAPLLTLASAMITIPSTSFQGHQNMEIRLVTFCTCAGTEMVHANITLKLPNLGDMQIKNWNVRFNPNWYKIIMYSKQNF